MQTAEDIRLLQDKIVEASGFIDKVNQELHKNIIGQQDMIDRLLIGLLCNGHILLEGVPGLAKTLTIKSLAQAINVSFSRIQFTPDLLPADVVGTMIYNQQKGDFVVRRGPIFANFILADEIKRSSFTQDEQQALMKKMEEVKNIYRSKHDIKEITKNDLAQKVFDHYKQNKKHQKTLKNAFLSQFFQAN